MNFEIKPATKGIPDACDIIIVLSRQSEAKMSVMLAGGTEELTAKAKEELKEGNLEWALRLSDDVLVIEPHNANAFETKKATILALAEETTNSQARNMLLSEYMLITGQSTLAFDVKDSDTIYSNMNQIAVDLMPIETLNKIMAVNLNASKSMQTELLVKLDLKDVKEGTSSKYILNVRKGILEIDPPNASEIQFTIVTDEMTWKKLILNKMTPQDAIDKKVVTISSGTKENFYTFMDLFK